MLTIWWCWSYRFEVFWYDGQRVEPDAEADDEDVEDRQHLHELVEHRSMPMQADQTRAVDDDAADDAGKTWRTSVISTKEIAIEVGGKPDLIVAGRQTKNLMIFWNAR